MGYPPAMYAFGVRLKDDYYIESSLHSQKDGQGYIDSAVRGGFMPKGPEPEYYMRVYRQWP